MLLLILLVNNLKLYSFFIITSFFNLINKFIVYTYHLTRLSEFDTLANVNVLIFAL